MKKLALLFLGFGVLHAMEKEEPSFSLFGQLPQEIKNEVLKALQSTNLTTARNPEQAVDRFKTTLKNLRLVDKQFLQFNPRTIAIVTFLNQAIKKFPDHGVRIARLLDTPEAIDWLKSQLNYTIKETKNTDIDQAVSFIADNKLVSLTRWLKQGYDPNSLSSQGLPLLFTAIENANIDAVKKLVSYGANFNAPIQAYDLNFVGTPLQLVQVLQQGGLNASKLTLIADFLRTQGAQ